MIILTEQLKDICNKILPAVDSTSLNTVTETLELVTKGKELFLNVTNKEYFVTVKLALEEEEDFRVTVNASLFLRLVSQITTEYIELTSTDTSLLVKGNGKYTLPLIFEEDRLMKLPDIEIPEVTKEFNINTSILKSILNYNSKELSRGVVTQAVQKLYYVDNKGSITFTTGACVNSFTLPEDVKLLFNNRLVKLFKLFTEDTVKFSLGHYTTADGSIQTRVRFVTSNIIISAILANEDSLFNSIPVEGIRARANTNYPYSVSIDRNILAQAINRILLFNNTSDSSAFTYNVFEFNKDGITIMDIDKVNKETITYYTQDTETTNDFNYSAIFDLNDIKAVVDNYSQPFLKIGFGNEQAIVISEGSIKNVIPECSLG